MSSVALEFNVSCLCHTACISSASHVIDHTKTLGQLVYEACADAVYPALRYIARCGMVGWRAVLRARTS